jgi:hypothetical protein
MQRPITPSNFDEKLREILTRLGNDYDGEAGLLFSSEDHVLAAAAAIKTAIAGLPEMQNEKLTAFENDGHGYYKVSRNELRAEIRTAMGLGEKG